MTVAARAISSPMARSLENLLVHLFLLLVLRCPLPISAVRKGGLPLERRSCRTTVQGRYLISDDVGHVCNALSLDYFSRCCPKTGERYSCQGCNLVSRCCDTYEYCVSCCLNPTRTKEELAVQVKLAKAATAGTYASVFDFCVGRCRHNSESVIHENAYGSDFHHCFSPSSNLSGTTDTPVEARLTGIDVVIGKQGESCNSVCKSKGLSCVPNKLVVLNSCEFLQKFLSCKGACLASIGSDQPAEVVDDAPRHLEHVCTQKLKGFCHVMAYISKQGDFVPVHSKLRLRPLKGKVLLFGLLFVKHEKR